MTVIKKFTTIQIDTDRVNDDINISLTYGEITGPYYSEEHPEQEFDTEDEAIEYAHSFNPWGRWLIIPLIRFDKN